MELANERGVSVEEGQYTMEQLLQADECFITNTCIEIMPVSRIGDSQIGQGRRGPLTGELRKVFTENLNRYLGPCLTALNA